MAMSSILKFQTIQKMGLGQTCQDKNMGAATADFIKI